MTEFASAIADLRLSGEKLNQDAATIRSQLIRLTTQLEEQATVQLTLGIDVRQAQRDLQRAISTFQSAGGFNIPVGIDVDAALDDLSALTSIDEPVVVPVVADTDAAVDELGALTSLLAIDPAVLEVEVDDSAATSSLQQLEQTALPEVQQAFGQAGASAGQEFADQLQSTVFRAVGGFSIALGAFTATSLFRGFQRLSTIEDATASLTVALDSTTAAARVLDDVLTVVQGTPFNLDQFANAASNLISFGVEAEKVPTFLEAIAEASASRGSRANEFAQRLANTFGQISVQGRITGEDILSLQATGVDALRILGNSFGETTISVRELVSEGAIPATEALDVLAEGILNGSDGLNGATVAFAGTAETLRQTLTGAIGGFESATARLGASVIGPFSEALTVGFTAATEIVDGFTDTFDELLFDLTQSEGFESFVENISKLPDLLDPFLEQLAELGPALAPLAAAFAALGANQLFTFLGPLGLAIPQLNAFTIAITALVAATPELREAFTPIIADLGEAVAILGAGLGEALGDSIEALIPLFESLANALGDLTPFITDIATFSVALAQGLVPVLDGLATVLNLFPVEILAGIGGGFLALQGLNAATGPIDRLTSSLTGFGTQLQLAEADSDRFGTRFTGIAQKVGVDGQTVTKAAGQLSTALDVAASAAAGFFSGIALASEDATTKALGFVGAATSVATAFATGGPVGGLTATAATVGGALVKVWTDSQQAAEEYRELINSVAEDVIEDLDAATAALLDARGLLSEDAVQEEVLSFLSTEELQRLEAAGVSIENLLDLAAEDPEIGQALGDSYEEALDRALTATNVFVAERDIEEGAAPGFGTTSAEDAANFFAEELARQLQPAVDEVAGTVDLSGLLDFGDVEGTLDTTGVFDLTRDPNGDFRRTTEFLENTSTLVGDVAEQLDEIDAQERIELGIEVGDFIDDFDLTVQQQQAFREAVAESKLDSEGLSDAIREAADNTEAYLEATDDLAEFGVTPFDLILNGIVDTEEEFGVLIEIADDGSLSITKDLSDIEEGADDLATAVEQAGAALETAFELADAAAQAFSDTLQDQLSALDVIIDRQDFLAGQRDFEASLSGVINQDELDDAQRLVEDIGDTRESITDLQATLADEQAQANIDLDILNRRIADAEARGSTEGLAALLRERDNVLDDVNDTQSEINEQIAQVAELEAEVARLSQAPITLEQLLRSQADSLGISFVELLITAPTAEAQEFFQSQVVGQIQNAASVIQNSVDENPLLAQVEIPSIVSELVGSFVAGGLSEEEADELVAEALQPDVLAQKASEQFIAEFEAALAVADAATAALLSGEEIDPSLNVEATLEDINGGIENLKELEDAGVEIPAGLDLLAAETTLSEFESAVEDEDFELLIPVEGDLSGIIASLEGLEEYSIQLQVRRAEENAVTLPNGEQGFRLPGGGIIFKEGGFYFENGSENHVAQISNGQTPYRVWSEPETGGEAYIPLGQSKRTQSTRILASVADVFGMDVIPRARQAAAAASTALDEGTTARAVETGVRRAQGRPSPIARAQAHDRAAKSVNVEKIEVSGVRDPNAAVRKMIRSLSDVAMGLTDWDEWD